MYSVSLKNSRPSRASLVLLIALWLTSRPGYAAVETTDTEEFRNRARREALERERQLQAPNVNLQGEVPKVEPGQFPSAETPCFTVQNFVLEVPSQLSPAAQRYGASTSFRFARDLLEQYRGRCIGREGINFLIRGVTAKILERGYSTTRLGIPEQDMLTGTLKFTLVPGIIHELRFAEAGATGTWKNAFPASAGSLLNLRDLEQGLEQMKRVSSQDVDMQIVPAGNLGESDVVISVKRTKPWRVVTSLDDSGAKGTGKLQAALQAGWDNLLGANDLFSIGASTDGDRNNHMRGTAGNFFSYSVPLGYWTGTVSWNDYRYHQRIIGAAQSFVSSGKSESFEAKVSYLFHRDQFSKSSLQFRTSRRSSHSFIDDTEVAVQKRDTALAEIALIHKHNVGEAQLDATLAYRWGVPWFEAQTDPPNLPADSPHYGYKLETLDVALIAPFRIAERPVSYSATFRAQNTNSALYATEWFVIGNRWTVRGFDGESVLGAEKGFFMRNEIGVPISGTAQSAYIGLDFGKVFGDNVPNLVGNKLAGIAGGLKGTIAKSLSYDVFVSSALNKPHNYRTDSPAAGFSLMYQM